VPDIAAFCSYVGTAGCFLGTSQALREKLPDLHRVVLEPAESPVLSGGQPGTHHVEGGVVEVMAIPEAEGFAMARRAARADGIFSGPSTGVNLVAALRLAERLGPGRRVVTIQVDSGLKYLSGS
jgi:cysteine synthase